MKALIKIETATINAVSKVQVQELAQAQAEKICAMDNDKMLSAYTQIRKAEEFLSLVKDEVNEEIVKRNVVCEGLTIRHTTTHTIEDERINEIEAEIDRLKAEKKAIEKLKIARGEVVGTEVKSTVAYRW